MSKQSLKPESSSNQGDLQADFLLNKHVFRTCAYSAAGFGIGLAASLLFFKHKAAMTAFFAGSGAGYGIAGFTNDWSNYKKYTSWVKNQSQRGGQREGGQSVRDFDGFVMNQFAQSHRGQDKSSQQRDDNRHQERSSHQREDRGQDRSSQNRSDNQGQQKQDQQRHDRDQKSDSHQGQQGKQGGQSQQGGQQNKQQGQQHHHGKEEPMSVKAKQTSDIANQKSDKQAANPEPKMGQPPQPGHATQDRAKRTEDAVFSMSQTGGTDSKDEQQSGQRGPQNSSIPPSKRDWTGGHANQGVQQGQVHRGKPEDDKTGKSLAPSTDPKKEQEKGPGKQENQALSGVDLKGQQLQTFQSNPLPLGKAGLTHEIQKTYQEGRNRANDPNLDNQQRLIKGMEQDRMGQSVKEGNNIKVKDRSDTEAGVGNYRVGVAEQLPKNQVNAVIE